MGSVSNKQQIYHCFRFVFCVVVVVGFSVTAAHQCNHHHDFDNPHHHVHHGNGDVGVVKKQQQLLPEELAEEEDLKLYGYGLHHNHGYETEHKHGDVVELSGLGTYFLLPSLIYFLKNQLHCEVVKFFDFVELFSLLLLWVLFSSMFWSIWFHKIVTGYRKHFISISEAYICIITKIGMSIRFKFLAFSKLIRNVNNGSGPLSW